jgi:cellulose synthase/poly-beta-1,6-N-acetylglucosamine synthase-like glycosyltransferase
MITIDPLEPARRLASPRYTPRAVPWISPLIGSGALILFFALVAMAFAAKGLAAWGTGLVYIFYDTCLLIFTGWQGRHLTAIANPEIGDGSRPSVVVIIAAHNEAAAIAVTINALLVQSDPPDHILVADDGSTDATGEILASQYGLSRPDIASVSASSPRVPTLSWLRLTHGGKARALNAALSHISADIIITVDADTLLEPGAIAAMRPRFAAEPNLVAATGVLTPVCGKGPTAHLFEWFQTYEYVRNFISRSAWMQINGLLLISGAFAAFRRSAVVKVGGFDPDCLVEDYELIHRLHRWSGEHGLSWTIRVIGEARARTDAPETLLTFLRQRRRWFAGFLQIQRWNRDMVGNGKFGWLGRAMMPVKTLDTLQPLYGLTAFILLIAFIATGRFSIALPILLVMIIKVIVDMAFHLWCLGRYRAWTGDRQSEGIFRALLAAIVEPFSFQLLRHAGAAWGWWTFLTGGQTWGTQTRRGIQAQILEK